MSNILYSLAIKSGVRQTNHNSTGRERQAVPLAHGFRKFWMNQAVKSKMPHEQREMLLGHKIGLASAYYRPSQEDMLDAYLIAVDNLTIEESNRLRKKVTDLEQKQTAITHLINRIDSLEKQLSG